MSCVPFTRRCRSTLRDRLQDIQYYHQEMECSQLDTGFGSANHVVGPEAGRPYDAGPYVVSRTLSFCPTA